MSDNQRRALCRIAFLFVCILPTSAVGYWILHPQTAGSWAGTIQAQLGVRTHIDSVETPQPYKTILRGVRFEDPDEGLLMSTSVVEIEFGQYNLVTIPYKVQGLTNRGLARFIEQLNRSVIRGQTIEKPWKVVFPEKTLVQRASEVGNELGPLVPPPPMDFATGMGQTAPFTGEPLPHVPTSITLANLTVSVQAQLDGTFADATFSLPDSRRPDQFVSATISKTETLGQQIELKTHEVDVPCWLIESQIPLVNESLGSDASFVGTVLLASRGRDSKVTLLGNFDGVAVPSERGQTPASIVVESEFINGQTHSWMAELRLAGRRPMPIEANSLMTTRRQIDPKLAIAKTIQSQQAASYTAKAGFEEPTPDRSLQRR